jgi:uncharacterized RDD family membrane protein YckC
MSNVENIKYAKLSSRFFALIIDYAILCCIFFPVTYFVKGVWIMSREDHLWKILDPRIVFDPLCLIFLIVIFLYWILSEGFFGYTPGKFIMRIRVVNYNFDKITMTQSIIRNFGRMPDGLPFLNIAGVVCILKTEKKQRIGDILAKTLVMNYSGQASMYQQNSRI